MLKSQEIQVLYLGANVPLKDLEFVANLKNPQYIFTHLTSIPGRFNLEKYLQQIHQRIPSIPLVLTGMLVQSYSKKLPSNILIKRSFEELTKHIHTM